MASFVEGKYVKYHLGEKGIWAHVDALHAHPPQSDMFTGKIVEGIGERINCSGIISIVSRTIADLNRPRNARNKEAIDEYRQTIRKILRYIDGLDKAGKVIRPYLHLAIHGMKDTWNSEIEIGTLRGRTCSQEVKKWFVDKIKKTIEDLQVDKKFPGDPSKSVHRHGDHKSNTGYAGYGSNYHTFQIEISNNLRKYHQEGLIDMLCNIIVDFNEQF